MFEALEAWKLGASELDIVKQGTWTFDPDFPMKKLNADRGAAPTATLLDPKGELGRLLALMHEVDQAGGRPLLAPLRHGAPKSPAK